MAVNAGAMQLDGKSSLAGNSLNALTSFRGHWPEYLMEADELGLYMFLTCLSAFVVRHPASPFNTCLLALCLGASRWDWEMGATTTAIITFTVGQADPRFTHTIVPCSRGLCSRAGLPTSRMLFKKASWKTQPKGNARMKHITHDVGVAAQIGNYSDAIETAPNTSLVTYVRYAGPVERKTITQRNCRTIETRLGTHLRSFE